LKNLPPIDFRAMVDLIGAAQSGLKHFFAPIKGNDSQTNNDYPLVHAVSSAYPNGITVQNLRILTSVTSSITVNFERWKNLNGSGIVTVAPVQTVNALEASDSGSISAAKISVGHILVADLPATTGCTNIVVEGTFTVD
jgi:hypothetical protein